MLLLSTGSPAAIPRASGHPAQVGPATYCADQNAVFKDRHPFVGITDDYVAVAPSRFRACSFGRMAAAGIGYFRVNMNWNNIEYPRGQYDFAFDDQLVAQLAEYHLTALPIVYGEPAWESSAPAGATNPAGYPPKNDAHYAQFVAMLVKRYGLGGTFWRANPKLPYYPVRAIQIWNEPNLTRQWEPKPNASAYVRLLRAAYRTVKRVNRRETVVTAGMAALSAREEPSWLDALFHAGINGNFDVLAIHLYGPTPQWALNRLKSARQIMDRFGDRRTPLWLTEFGWAGGPPDPYLASQRGQRVNLAAFLRLLSPDRARLGLGELIWYGWQDKVYGPDPSWWGYHLGLYTASLHPKPALNVLAAAAKRFDR
jgi:hypothetical protein